jgi:hypothetical protein
VHNYLIVSWVALNKHHRTKKLNLHNRHHPKESVSKHSERMYVHGALTENYARAINEFNDLLIVLSMANEVYAVVCFYHYF